MCDLFGSLADCSHIKLPSFYYNGRRKEFDQSAFVDWYNNLTLHGRGNVGLQRANQIMRKHALNTKEHLRKYIKEIYKREKEWRV